jgi:hypothetical protein
MISSINMKLTINEMVEALIYQISGMQNYAQMEALILNIPRAAAVHGLPVSECFSKLEIRIEKLSPMDLTSTRWSCFPILC